MYHKLDNRTEKLAKELEEIKQRIKAIEEILRENPPDPGEKESPVNHAELLQFLTELNAKKSQIEKQLASVAALPNTSPERQISREESEKNTRAGNNSEEDSALTKLDPELKLIIFHNLKEQKDLINLFKTSKSMRGVFNQTLLGRVNKLILAINANEVDAVKRILFDETLELGDLLNYEIQRRGKSFSCYDIAMYIATKQNNEQIRRLLLRAKLALFETDEFYKNFKTSDEAKNFIENVKDKIMALLLSDNKGDYEKNKLELTLLLAIEPKERDKRNSLALFLNMLPNDLSLWLLQERLITTKLLFCYMTDVHGAKEKRFQDYLRRIIFLDSVSGLEFLIAHKIIPIRDGDDCRAIWLNAISWPCMSKDIYDQSMILQYLFEYHSTMTKPEVLFFPLCKQNSVKLLSYLPEQVITAISAETIFFTITQAKIVNFELMQFFLALLKRKENNEVTENEAKIAANCIGYVAQSGHYDLFVYLVEKYHLNLNGSIFGKALSSGNIQLADYIYSKIQIQISGKDIIAYIMKYSLKNRIEMAQWLIFTKNIIFYDYPRPSKPDLEQQTIINMLINKSLLDHIKDLRNSLMEKARELPRDSLAEAEALSAKARLMDTLYHWIMEEPREPLATIINKRLNTESDWQTLLDLFKMAESQFSKKSNYSPRFHNGHSEKVSPINEATDTLKFLIMKTLVEDHSKEGRMAVEGLNLLFAQSLETQVKPGDSDKRCSIS